MKYPSSAPRPPSLSLHLPLSLSRSLSSLWNVYADVRNSDDSSLNTGWTRITPGNDFIPLGSVRGEGKGDFDSHICFASGNPLRTEDGVKIFYMGGDGPHYSPPFPSPLHRNSSFGLATLRQDGTAISHRTLVKSRGPQDGCSTPRWPARNGCPRYHHQRSSRGSVASYISVILNV